MKNKSYLMTSEKVQALSAKSEYVLEKPQSAQRAQRKAANLCVLCVLCGQLFLLVFSYSNNWIRKCVYTFLCVKKPQINADERRFIVLNPEQFVEFLIGAKLINSPQKTQRAQNAGIFKIFFEKTLILGRRTRITRIWRIFTDPCASVSTVTPVDCVHTYASALAYVDVYSAQSVFHCIPSALIRVHLRSAESKITPQSTQSMAAVIFASFALFAVRFIISLNEWSIAKPSAFISVHPRSIYRMTPTEGR